MATHCAIGRACNVHLNSSYTSDFFSACQAVILNFAIRNLVNKIPMQCGIFLIICHIRYRTCLSKKNIMYIKFCDENKFYIYKILARQNFILYKIIASQNFIYICQLRSREFFVLYYIFWSVEENCETKIYV